MKQQRNDFGGVMNNDKMPYLISTATHFVLPRANVGAGSHAMVKEADYFISSGGLSGKLNRDGIAWGRNWIPVVADGLEHARLLAWFIGSGTEHPSSISFTPPNRLTVAQILGHETVQEKAS